VIPRQFAEFLARLRRGPSEQDRARLAAVLTLNRALARAASRTELLRLLLDEAVHLFGAERGFVIRAGVGDDFRVELARSLDREPVHRPERKLSSTVVRRCLSTRAGVFQDDAQEGDFAASSSVADLKLRSVLCMPLTVGDRCLGCIYLDHRFRSGVFHADDLPWFEAFADQGAIALHLHDLLEQSRRIQAAVESENRELAARVAAQAEALVELDAPTRDRLAHAYPEIVGSSPALLRYLAVLDRVTEGDYPVLLCGESGSGKELAARAIHAHGRRAAGPFVPINVAAIAPGLLESELFGHVRGAFSGAVEPRIGCIREAASGVLFLDEITEMQVELQAKLLRFLESHEVRPVGGDASETVDLRVVAATNRDPAAAVAEGKLRADLYYRLAVVTVAVPSLRERRADIPELVGLFLRQAARDRGAATSRGVAPDLIDALTRRTWPGNLRQLRNEVYRLDAMAVGDEIGPALLPSEPVGPAAPPDLDLARLERWAIEAALERADGNKAEAARLLGISRRALYNKLGRS
jgi:DNA-binding NtrC family response regulator